MRYQHNFFRIRQFPGAYSLYPPEVTDPIYTLQREQTLLYDIVSITQRADCDNALVQGVGADWVYSLMLMLLLMRKIRIFTSVLLHEAW